MAMNYEIRGGSGNSLFFCPQNVIQQERMALAYNEVNMNAMNQAPQEIALWNLSRDYNSLLWCNSHSFIGEYCRGGCAGTLNYYNGVGNQWIPLQPNCIPNSFHCQNKIVCRNFNIGCISGSPNAMYSGGLSNMTMHPENRQTIADVNQACSNSPKSPAAWRPSIPMAYMMSRWTPEDLLRAVRAVLPRFWSWTDEDILSDAKCIAEVERSP